MVWVCGFGFWFDLPCGVLNYLPVGGCFRVFGV